jgi:hypothetical protein
VFYEIPVIKNRTREQKAEIVFEELMAKQFFILMQTINSQINDGQSTSNRINIRKVY